MNPDVPPVLPHDTASSPPAAPETGLSRSAIIALFVAAIRLMIGCVVFDCIRFRERTSHLPPTDRLTTILVGYLSPSIIAPFLVALPFFIFARRNAGKRFVVAFFSVVAIIAFSKLGQLARLANKPGLREPVANIPGALKVQNKTPTFSIQMPRGFEDRSELKSSPSVTHIFMGSQPGETGTQAVVYINTLSSILAPRTELNRKRLKESMPADVALVTKNWRGLPVDTFVSHVATNDIKLVVYQIRIPLKPKAIELTISGAASNSENLSALADTLLTSLDGPTSW